MAFDAVFSSPENTVNMILDLGADLDFLLRRIGCSRSRLDALGYWLAQPSLAFSWLAPKVLFFFMFVCFFSLLFVYGVFQARLFSATSYDQIMRLGLEGAEFGSLSDLATGSEGPSWFLLWPCR